MLTRHNKLLTCSLILLIGTLAGQAFAGGAARLEGRLSEPDALVVTSRATALMRTDGGFVRAESGALRHARGRFEGGFLHLTAEGLSPNSRYVVLHGRTPVASFASDSQGRYAERFTQGIEVDGLRRVERPDVRYAAGLVNLRLVELSSGRTFGAHRLVEKSDRTDDDVRSTPLCSNDPAVAGDATAMSLGDQQILMVMGWGVPASTELTVVVDGVLVGGKESDEWGFFEFFAGDDPMADVPLPPELDPITDAVDITVLDGDTVVLFGNFVEPCDGGGGGGDIVDAGSITLCSEDGDYPLGWVDWVVFTDGLETAMVNAFELPPTSPVEIIFDSTIVGTVATSEWGDLFVVFSSDPQLDELPLPPGTPPLDEVETVAMVSNGQPLASGTAGEECWDIDPPPVVEEAFTDLCPTDDQNAGAFGSTSWSIWDDGTEMFSVFAAGLQPEQELRLVVDGNDLGLFTVSEWGDLMLAFSSDPDHDWPPGQMGDPLPLPDEIRPVSEIDQVGLFDGDDAVVAGSFVDGCDLPEPPQPVDQGLTQLCPTDDLLFAWGDTGWFVWDDGNEDFYVFVFGLEPSAQLTLVVDGHDLGTHDVSEWGELYLLFSSDPDGVNFPRDNPGVPPGDQALPLPDEIRPVSAIDAVSLVPPGGDAVVAGSFSDPCEPPEPPDPPQPVDEGYASLCPTTQDAVSGDVYWVVWDSGVEGLMLSAWPVTPYETYEIVIDGFNLGAFEGDEGGFLWADFSSSPEYDGQLLLPEEVQPVTDIDIVEILDGDGAVVSRGSFSEPCSLQWDLETAETGLCDVDGNNVGLSSWWISSVNGDVVEKAFEVVYFTGSDNVVYSVTIDGIDVGDMEFGWWNNPLLMLSLGTPGNSPVPQELRPISGIDTVRIFDGDDVVAEGSFLEPCTGIGTGGGDEARKPEVAPVESD